MNKNFMYGIGAVKYKDFTIGYIEKNSFDLGGKKPEAAKIEAEQVQGAPAQKSAGNICRHIRGNLFKVRMWKILLLIM